MHKYRGNMLLGHNLYSIRRYSILIVLIISECMYINFENRNTKQLTLKYLIEYL
jgi:hypothetical protein